MSASKRGAGQWYAVRCISRFIASAGRAVIAEVGTVVAEFKATRALRRRRTNLQGLNDHALRDIGLVKDRFTGTVLNDLSGKDPDLEVLHAETVLAASSETPDFHMVERRRAERRTAERRCIARQKFAEKKDVQPAAAYPGQDRRAYDRRASDHRVIDCRDLFSGRPRFLLT